MIICKKINIEELCRCDFIKIESKVEKEPKVDVSKGTSHFLADELTQNIYILKKN